MLDQADNHAGYAIGPAHSHCAIRHPRFSDLRVYLEMPLLMELEGVGLLACTAGERNFEVQRPGSAREACTAVAQG